MNEKTPHFSTISHNFKHRFTEETIENIFYWILSEIDKAGYLSPETVFVDGTHIKANANMKKVVKKEIPKAAKIYEKQLMEEINEDREEHGKKPFDEPKPPEKKTVNESTTDPESGVFHKGEHKKSLTKFQQIPYLSIKLPLKTPSSLCEKDLFRACSRKTVQNS